MPQDIRQAWDSRKAGAAAQADWQRVSPPTPRLPGRGRRVHAPHEGRSAGRLAEKAQAFLAATAARGETVATRKASQFAIAELAGLLPELLGGSADLTGSNFTDWKGVAAVRAADKGGVSFGRHINYGVREFGMAAIMNGIALHGGYLPFGGTS